MMSQTTHFVTPMESPSQSIQSTGVGIIEFLKSEFVACLIAVQDQATQEACATAVEDTARPKGLSLRCTATAGRTRRRLRCLIR